MAENDIDVDDLAKQHKEETSDGRAGAEAPSERDDAADDEDTPDTLEDWIRQGYHKLENDEIPTNLTIRDENLAALFYGLKESGELEALGDAAADKLDSDKDADSKAGVLRLLTRVSLEAVDESVIDAGKEGRKRFEADQREDF